MSLVSADVAQGSRNAGTPVHEDDCLEKRKRALFGWCLYSKQWRAFSTSDCSSWSPPPWLAFQWVFRSLIWAISTLHLLACKLYVAADNILRVPTPLNAWRTLRALEAENELDAYKLDKLGLWALLLLYMQAAAFVSFVGFLGVLGNKATHVRLYCDCSAADLLFTAFLTLLAIYITFSPIALPASLDAPLLFCLQPRIRILVLKHIGPALRRRWRNPRRTPCAWRATSPRRAAVSVSAGMVVRLHFLLAVSMHYAHMLRSAPSAPTPSFDGTDAELAMSLTSTLATPTRIRIPPTPRTPPTQRRRVRPRARRHAVRVDPPREGGKYRVALAGHSETCERWLERAAVGVGAGMVVRLHFLLVVSTHYAHMLCSSSSSHDNDSNAADAEQGAALLTTLTTLPRIRILPLPTHLSPNDVV
ncbi:hypothetical protein C8J57DRAFT_1471169 [Mycena rebaudengoi]|nr:hypothetical protein C8J57DRAFT_1471169 [Mycena rebaudengoi]